MSRQAKALCMLFGISIVMASCTAELMTTRTPAKGAVIKPM
jgi:hypothetical protein